jgi:homoserine dehydrogenase
VLNSTSNLVMQAMARGVPMSEAVQDAQARGIAEADPAHDLDGWITPSRRSSWATSRSARICVRPTQRTPLDAVDLDWLRAEERAGSTVRLAASGDARGAARVGPLSFPAGSFLASLAGGSLGIEIETEMAGTLRVSGVDPGVEHTAYGMLSDLVAIHQGRRVVPRAARLGARPGRMARTGCLGRRQGVRRSRCGFIGDDEQRSHRPQ